MAASKFLFASILLLSFLAEICYGAILFSSLQNTLVVTASPKQGEVLKAGENNITVTWMLNQSLPGGTDATYKTIKLKLCYAPISQVQHAWRKTENELDRDKSCKFMIVAKPYTPSSKTVETFEGIIHKEIPTATYFVGAYAFNSEGNQVAYGQNTDAKRTTNLFDIEAISGRHTSLDIASVSFSAFSIVSLFGFFIAEKRKGKTEQQK